MYSQLLFSLPVSQLISSLFFSFFAAFFYVCAHHIVCGTNILVMLDDLECSASACDCFFSLFFQVSVRSRMLTTSHLFKIFKLLKWGKVVRSSATVTAGSYHNIFSENKILTICETEDVFGDSFRSITVEFRSLSSLRMNSFIRGDDTTIEESQSTESPSTSERGKSPWGLKSLK